MKKTILLSIIIYLLFNFVSAYQCYQETANVSTSCGGLATGTYSKDNNWINYPNTIDGNYSTSGVENIDATAYVNYSKPLKLKGAVWQVSDGNEGDIYNLTVTSDCYGYYSDKISLMYVSKGTDPYYVTWSCFNGTWRTLREQSIIAPFVYDEAIIWDIDKPLYQCYQETANVSTSCGGLATGTYSNGTTGVWINYNNSIDGNYSNFADSGGGLPTGYVNYSKPNKNYVFNATWQIKYGESGAMANVSIPSSCYNKYANTLSLNYILKLTNISVNCFDGTWNELGFAGVYQDNFYEEAIYWNMFDMTNPSLTVYTPTGSYSNISYIPLNFTASDDISLDTCFYNVTLSSGLYMASSNVSCTDNSSIALPLSGDNDFNLTMCVNDTSSNLNCSYSTFSTVNYVSPIIVISGGGGSSSQVPINVSIFSSSYGDKIDLVLAKGSIRERSKQIIVVNFETNSVNIKLKCVPTNYTSVKEVDICDYVNFSLTDFQVSPNELDPSYIDVSIRTPETAEYGDIYNFNVVGEVQGFSLADPKISVSARVPFYASAFKFSFIPLQDENKYSYPVFPISFMAGFILAILVYIIFRKLEFTSILLSMITFFVSVGLLLYFL